MNFLETISSPSYPACLFYSFHFPLISTFSNEFMKNLSKSLKHSRNFEKKTNRRNRLGQKTKSDTYKILRYKNFKDLWKTIEEESDEEFFYEEKWSGLSTLEIARSSWYCGFLWTPFPLEDQIIRAIFG